MVHSEMLQKDDYVKKLRKWHQNLDDDGSGDVSFEELDRHINDPEVAAFAKTLEIEIMDVRQLFMVLSHNGTKSVDLETFVVGCIRLKGLARSLDLMELIYNGKAERSQRQKFEANCNRDLAAIKRFIIEGCADICDFNEDNSPMS